MGVRVLDHDLRSWAVVIALIVSTWKLVIWWAWAVWVKSGEIACLHRDRQDPAKMSLIYPIRLLSMNSTEVVFRARITTNWTRSRGMRVGWPTAAGRVQPPRKTACIRTWLRVKWTGDLTCSGKFPTLSVVQSTITKTAKITSKESTRAWSDNSYELKRKPVSFAPRTSG